MNSRCQLLLLFSHSNAELILFSPFVHHFANAGSPEYTYASKAFQAALSAVRIAEVMHKHLWLHEAYFHVLDVLAFAAVVLLTVERTTVAGPMLMEAVQGSKKVKELLLLLSLNNPTAREIWTVLESVSAHADSAQQSAGVVKRPATLYSQDSGVDVSPVGSCFNPSPLLVESEAVPLAMPVEVDSVMG